MKERHLRFGMGFVVLLLVLLVGLVIRETFFNSQKLEEEGYTSLIKMPLRSVEINKWPRWRIIAELVGGVRYELPITNIVVIFDGRLDGTYLQVDGCAPVSVDFSRPLVCFGNNILTVSDINNYGRWQNFLTYQILEMNKYEKDDNPREVSPP